MEEILKNHKIYSFGSVSFQHINSFKVGSASKLPLGAKSVLVVIFPYYSKNAFCGNISGYCSVKDYHFEVMEQLKSIIIDLQKLYPTQKFVPFVDASPIDEVDAAIKAGLGVRGENSLLITPLYGSFVFIGEIVTTLQLEDVLWEEKSCCRCGLCTRSCPGQCIGGAKAWDRKAKIAPESPSVATGGKIAPESCWGIYSEHCASFISQKKQELTPNQLAILKKADTVFGCDICQLVCPHNRGIIAQNPPAAPCDKNLFTQDILNTVTLENVENIYKARAFGFRGLKVLQRNLEIYGENHKL